MYASPHSCLAVTVWIALAVLPVIPAFLVLPSLQRPSFGSTHTHRWQNSPQCRSCLCMSSVTESTDPFQLLNIGISADKIEIKRAYKQMALKYHPDVVTNQDTTPEQKKRANDVFAKINWAYAFLSTRDRGTGRTSSSTSTSTSSTSAATSSSSSPGTTPPPHRQTSTPYDYNPNQASTDRRDNMPEYELENQAHTRYAGGDDFDKKLEDLFNGVANGGSGDILSDYDNFLEVNGDGYSSGEEEEEENAQLQMLLKTGSVEQVGMQLEEQELVVRQLESKRENMADEVRQGRRKIASTNLYLEKKELEKEVADLEARKHLVDGDLQEARLRLSALQARHEQLVMIGEIHGYARGHRRSSSRSTSSSSHSTTSPSTRGTSAASSSTPPPPRQDSPVTPPPPRQTRTPRPQSSTTYSNGSTASSPSSSSSTSSSEKEAWIHEEFGSNYRGRSRDTRSTASSSQRQPYSFYTPPPPPRQESTSTSGTYRNGSTFHYGTTVNTREQQLENDGAQSANLGWTILLRDNVSGDTLSLAEKEILKAATWVFEFSLRQRAHCIASRMLDEHLRNPAGDEWSSPVPNPENPAEAVALKLVEFAPSGERKQTDEKSRTLTNNAPLGKNSDMKRTNFTQTVSMRTAEQQTDDEKKPVVDYEKAQASSLQNQDGELDQGLMEKLAGYTDAEENPRSLHLFEEQIKKEDEDKVLPANSDADALSMTRAFNRMERVATTKKEKVKAKKRVVWLTRHIRILEAHKTRLPTGYFKAERCKGNVLGSLCSIYSIPAKKKDGTINKANKKRLAIQKELGEKNPKRVFDNALEDLKQQLVSEMITAA